VTEPVWEPTVALSRSRDQFVVFPLCENQWRRGFPVWEPSVVTRIPGLGTNCGG